jgi:G:T/U-mismatch repair DNA glycosylase
VNDLASLRQRCPNLQAIAHNGGESFKHAKHSASLGLPIYRLPSTSAANASWSFERKLAAWQDVFKIHGLI